MTGSLIESRLTNKGFRPEVLCLFMISHSDVPAESSGRYFIQKPTLIGCYFIVNGEHLLVRLFTLNNRH